MTGTELFSVYGKLGLDKGDFDRDISTAENQGRGFAVTMGKAAAGVAKFGAGIAVATKGIGAAAIATGGQWNQMGDAIQTQTGMLDESRDKIKMFARDTALEGNFLATSILNSAGTIAVAGMEAEDKILKLKAGMSLAGAVGEYLGNTVSFVADYLVKVGKDATYADEKTNIFAATVRNTRIPLNELQKNLFNSNVTLQAVNMETAESAAMFGLLYQRGIYGARAYSGMENAMRSLLQPTQDQLAALNRLGIAREDENGQLRNGVDFMTDVAGALESLEGAQRAYYIQLLGSTAMGQAFLGGMIEIKDDLPSLINALHNAGDASYYAAQNQRSLLNTLSVFPAVGRDALKTIFDLIEAPLGESLGNAADEARNFVERLRDTDDLHPYVMQLADAITGLVGGVVNFGVAAAPIVMQVLPMAATTLTGILDVAIPLAPAIMGLYVATKLYNSQLLIQGSVLTTQIAQKGLLTAAQLKLNAAMTANPIGLVIAGVVALTGVIITLTNTIQRETDVAREAAIGGA